jgi:single-stranded DNA-specific DHH superfamily exonuclease
MKKCKDLLISFGGHPAASGFRIKNENLEKFKKCLVENL